MTSARDGWPLRTYVDPSAGEPAGSILWLGGRGDIVEKYLEQIHGWALGGWHVTSFDWRGQGGSGRLGRDPHIGHVDDFAIWIDDLADFYADWAAGHPAPHVVMGHSMGGHLALRALAEQRINPGKVVLIAPMLGFDTRGIPFRRGAALTRMMATFSALRPAWKSNERPAPPNASRQAFLTHDKARYADELWWKERHRELALGPPSWSWLAAAYRSIDTLQRDGAVEHIVTDVLILCADADQLVRARAIREFASRLPNARLVAFGDDTAHEILREADGPRNRALAAIDEFLK